VRGFTHAATRRGIEVWGSHFGLEGLLGRADVTLLGIRDVRGILPRGGSILGCSTKSNPFASAPEGESPTDRAEWLKRLVSPRFDALVLAGGDGTMGIARSLDEIGVGCVGLPKTIDGDLGATEQTCGIDTAVETATHAIDSLHSTAEAHQRVMIVEVMGRTAGWIALRAGIAGGADAVLIPEIPYDPARVAAKIAEREGLGLRFSIIVVGEGARARGGLESVVEAAREGRPHRLGGAGQRLADELAALDIGHEIRVTVLGHLQRGGTPTAADRLLATRFGAHAAELCAERRFGRMVTLRGGEIDSVPLSEVQRAPRTIDPASEIVRCARAIGIELGAAPA
jgi:6-phosphofructokinase 1